MNYSKKYIKYKTKYLNLIEKICKFSEKKFKKIESEKMEPPINITINNINELTNNIAFSLIKYGHKNGECYNTGHFENAMSIYKKDQESTNIFNYLMKHICKSINKKIYLVDGMNFIFIFMKYLIENKQNTNIEKIFKMFGCKNMQVYHNLCKYSDESDIDNILNLDKNFEKDIYSKNLFINDLLHEIFINIMSNNKQDLYIVYHHGEYNTNQNMLINNNCVFLSTYLKNNIRPTINTFKGKIKDTIKSELMKNNTYEKEKLEYMINYEFYNKMEAGYTNDKIIKEFLKKYFDQVFANNKINSNVCKLSNETDDYCIVMLYYYLIELKLKNIMIVSDDHFGWNKDDINKNHVTKVETFLIKKINQLL